MFQGFPTNFYDKHTNFLFTDNHNILEKHINSHGQNTNFHALLTEKHIHSHGTNTSFEDATQGT